MELTSVFIESLSCGCGEIFTMIQRIMRVLTLFSFLTHILLQPFFSSVGIAQTVLFEENLDLGTSRRKLATQVEVQYAFSRPELVLSVSKISSDVWGSFNTHPRVAADVNGDGKADIIWFGGSGVYVSFSNGTAFSTPSLLLSVYGNNAGDWSSYDTYPRAAADVNGDGKADIIGFAGGGVYVSFSNGTGFSAPSFFLGDYGNNAPANGWTNFNLYPRTVADVNGDGKADIIGFSGEGACVSFSSGTSFSGRSWQLNNYGTNCPAAACWHSFQEYPRVVADLNYYRLKPVGWITLAKRIKRFKALHRKISNVTDPS